jgi:hypothetical protein
MSASRNFAAAFAAVTQVAQPLPPPSSRVVASDLVTDFVDACDTAIELAFEDPSAADLTPGLDIEEPAAMLKAYLLFLACWAPYSNGEDHNAAEVDDWFELVTPRVWQMLGFRARPTRLSLGLAFSLLGGREHQAPELRALMWAVRDFAASGLMPGLAA